MSAQGAKPGVHIEATAAGAIHHQRPRAGVYIANIATKGVTVPRAPHGAKTRVHTAGRQYLFKVLKCSKSTGLRSH